MNISLAQEKGITEGNYQLYANTDGFLEIDAAGAKWNAIHLDQQTQDKLNAYWGDKSFGYVGDVTDTRTIAEYAKKNGCRGVKISNVFDAQVFQHKQKKPSTVYNFFNPQEQVKSADPVTYDDYGNVIPLSERFDPKNDDLRYSLNTEGQESGVEKSTAKNGGVRYSASQAETQEGRATADFIQEVSQMIDIAKKSKRKLKIGVVSANHATRINRLMQTIKPKFSAEGYELWIDGTGASHIEDRHGKKGKADHSMASKEAKMLIPWAAQNAEEANFITNADGSIKLSGRFLNSDGTRSPEIRLQKRIDQDTVYVSECVPDSANKRVWITSAYIKKAAVIKS